MPPPDQNPLPDDAGDSLEDGPEEDAPALETEADVTCPHCGETMTITLDPGGGRAQENVEDCQVCCRPWRVGLWYDGAGAAGRGLLPAWKRSPPEGRVAHGGWSSAALPQGAQPCVCS